MLTLSHAAWFVWELLATCSYEEQCFSQSQVPYPIVWMTPSSSHGDTCLYRACGGEDDINVLTPLDAVTQLTLSTDVLLMLWLLQVLPRPLSAPRP